MPELLLFTMGFGTEAHTRACTGFVRPRRGTTRKELGDDVETGAKNKSQFKNSRKAEAKKRKLKADAKKGSGFQGAPQALAIGRAESEAAEGRKGQVQGQACRKALTGRRARARMFASHIRRGRSAFNNLVCLNVFAGGAGASTPEMVATPEADREAQIQPLGIPGRPHF